jgi:hypothetical protein
VLLLRTTVLLNWLRMVLLTSLVVLVLLLLLLLMMILPPQWPCVLLERCRPGCCYCEGCLNRGACMKKGVISAGQDVRKEFYLEV